jgi:predicted acylesterase/phospholipase RssA
MQPASDKNIIRSLIFAGGGVRLAYHAGVLIALEEAGIAFDHVDGTSGGIFGTAMLASGISPKEAAVRWRKLDLKGLMAAMPLGDYFNQNNLPGLGSADGIRKKIFPALGIRPEIIKTNTRFRATFNVCNFSKKTIECIDGKDINEDYLIAGMSLPVFMPALQINGDWYTDAVWIKDANITEAVKSGAEDVWLVWCIGNTNTYLNGSFNQYVHMIEISANGGLFAEIDWLRSVNEDRLSRGLKPVDLRIIKPEYALPLDPDFLFNKINADTLINMGYADTRQYMVVGNTFSDNETVSNTTAMKTADASLHLRQQFKGKLVIGGALNAVTICLSFFIHEADNRFVFQLYSSVSIAGSDFISGYENIIDVGLSGKVGARFRFVFNSVDYEAVLRMKFNSVPNILIGIDNKVAEVSITPTGSAKSNDTLFIQPAVNRIRNAFYLNVNANIVWYKRIKLKNRLLSQLVNHDEKV